MYTFHFSLLVPPHYLFCVHTSVRRPTTDHVCLPHSLSTLFCCVRICAVYVCLCVCVCVCACVHAHTCAHVCTDLCRHLLGKGLTRISPSISTNSLPYFLRIFNATWIWHFYYTGYWRVPGICQFLHLNAGIIVTEKRNLVFTWMPRFWTQVLMFSSRHLTQWAISSNIKISI